MKGEASKRIFDVFWAVTGLLFLSPVMLIISVLIRIVSPGPIIYRQKRVGENNVIFNLVKFRTMVVNADTMEGGSITVAGDSRITPAGKFLRRWKLDELPTIWNVLKGDMSFVGPRPDVPGYADKLTGDDRKILDLRPGITGPATLKYSNEEMLLANAADPEYFNDNILFPDKVKLNLEYLNNLSLWKDVLIICKSIFRTNY